MKTANTYYQEKYGCKVYKLSLDGGFTCPNRDGTLGYGGCRFCSAAGSGEFAAHGSEIASQLEQAKLRVAAKNKSGKYIAYFQSFTGTYAPTATLAQLYRQAMAPEYIVGLSIATRPDCLPEETLALLQELNQEKPVSVELGLQTMWDDSANAMHRGYATDVYMQAVAALKSRGISVVTHLILGLPGETREQMIASARFVGEQHSEGVKFHLLHVLRGSALEQDYREGKFSCLSLPEYAEILRECLLVLPESTVIHRITGDGAKADLIVPAWSADKKRVLNYLHRFLGDILI